MFKSALGVFHVLSKLQRLGTGIRARVSEIVSGGPVDALMKLNTIDSLDGLLNF